MTATKTTAAKRLWDSKTPAQKKLLRDLKKAREAAKKREREAKSSSNGVAHVEITGATAPLDHARDCFVCDLEDEITLGFHADLRRLRIGHIIELHLRRHDRRRSLAKEAAGHTHLTRSVRCRRDDRRLLHRHGYQDVVVVDTEIERDRERQTVHADHVLAHAVGDLEREAPAVLKMPYRILG